VRIISDDEFEQKIRPIYESLFTSDDAYDKPFKETVESRLLLYPYRFNLRKGEDWREPVLQAIRNLGETGFYVTIFIKPEDEPRHWYFTLDEVDLYCKKTFAWENIIYSTQGAWGIVSSEEDHAIAGGNQDFIRDVKESISDWDQRIDSFLKLWEYYYESNHVNLDWVLVLFTHIYGEQQAKKIILASNLRWLIRD
jgi:hypothetical protein